MEEGLHISLAAEPLFYVWGVSITNALMSSWVVMAVLIFIGFLVGRKVRLVPGKVQNVFEAGFEYVLGLMESMLGSRQMALRFFPLITTIFLFILFANIFHFFPFVGHTVGLSGEHGLVPLFRAPNTDLNMPLALAIISFLVIEISGILTLGVLKYGSKFVNFKAGAIGVLVGLVELIGNLARLISLSFRLFGNIFAGEVLLLVIAAFLPLVVPLPFLLFEVFIGFLQAAIFALLTLAFIKLAVEEPHTAEHSSAKKQGTSSKYQVDT
ncbi:MAG: F0F1 ATP synthase subunit A [Candidatus Adlerbacteria bacterium]|nr:F0F1 ATP synthase subunit A [Candidatus Adlerbacteria bacterium]